MIVKKIHSEVRLAAGNIFSVSSNSNSSLGTTNINIFFKNIDIISNISIHIISFNLLRKHDFHSKQLNLKSEQLQLENVCL